MILVDTPVWSFALRRKAEHLSPLQVRTKELLYQLISEGRAQLLGVVRQELLTGLPEESEFRRLKDYLQSFADAPITTEDYEEAARASNRCRQLGIAGSTVDMLICAIAIHHGWEILTTDLDFVNYRRVLKIQLTAV